MNINRIEYNFTEHYKYSVIGVPLGTLNNARIVHRYIVEGEEFYFISGHIGDELWNSLVSINVEKEELHEVSRLVMKATDIKGKTPLEVIEELYKNRRDRKV
jgi:uncharacterized phage-like protein YoqJ